MKRNKTLLVGATAVAATAGVVMAALPAFAADGKRSAGHGGGHGESGPVSLFVASLNGANEVPVQGGPAVGDHDGAALEFVQVQGDRVSVAVMFRGTDRPTALHIHQGAKGTKGTKGADGGDGGIKIDFGSLLANGKAKANGKGNGTAMAKAKAKGWTGAVTGSVTVKDRAVLDAFTADPNGFYAHLHTAKFPGGAVRGQFHKVTNPFRFERALGNSQASVVKGKQIYDCKKGADGTLSFQQRDVRAVLGGHIDHSFIAPNSGTPQWIAPDRSAVTGKLISRTPNGEKNIAELDLQATQSGKKKGLLAGVQEIFRLNTVGGVAPAGTCTEGAITGVPYGADYVFIKG